MAYTKCEESAKRFNAWSKRGGAVKGAPSPYARPATRHITFAPAVFVTPKNDPTVKWYRSDRKPIVIETPKSGFALGERATIKRADIEER